jgi:predicted GNAT family N-acyltransferase
LSISERDEFITFVGKAGEVNTGTLPALVNQALVLLTLSDGPNLIGTAALKRPSDGHRRGEFRKAGVERLADAYPVELGWIVVHEDYRGRGHAHALVTKALDISPKLGTYATTKSDQMRVILPQHGFLILGERYPSELNPNAELSLFGRTPSGK